MEIHGIHLELLQRHKCMDQWHPFPKFGARGPEAEVPLSAADRRPTRHEAACRPETYEIAAAAVRILEPRTVAWRGPPWKSLGLVHLLMVGAGTPILAAARPQNRNLISNRL